MKNLFALAGSLLLGLSVFAQPGVEVSFIDFQRSFPRPDVALKRKVDTLQKQFKQKGLEWPVKNIYIRSFKYDSQLEVWVRNSRNEPYKLFKTYRVCALAGTLGPKRMEGDYQVPEGFYYINEFNPRSTYHLSLGLNYPNPSDRLLSDSLRPGGDIYIHGSCVTVGCIPMNDQQIEELYILAAHAKDAGQDFIPVHIFPIRYENKKSAEYLTNLAKNDAGLKTFSDNLQKVYDHFEATHRLPVIMTAEDGTYVYSDLKKKAAPAPKPKFVPAQHRVRDINHLVAEVVNQWPVYPGGGEAFLQFLADAGKKMAPYLPEGIKKAYVQVEFIVDVDGTPTNFRMMKGMSPELDDRLISELEKMPNWKPAILQEKPVAKKMRQGFAIE